MIAANGADTKISAANDSANFPQHPGEDALAHAVQLYKEQSSARLAALGLLAVALHAIAPFAINYCSAH